MKRLDIIMEIVFVLIMAVLIVFFHCQKDWIFEGIALAVAIIAPLLMIWQNKKLKTNE